MTGRVNSSLCDARFAQLNSLSSTSNAKRKWSIFLIAHSYKEECGRLRVLLKQQHEQFNKEQEETVTPADFERLRDYAMQKEEELAKMHEEGSRLLEAY